MSPASAPGAPGAVLAPARDGDSDAELISRVRGGDVAAYGALFERHRTAAERLSRQLVTGPDVDDLVAEAFAKVLNVLLGGGGPDVAFRPYLLTSVRRLHVDKIRATKRAMPTDDLTPYDPGVPFADTVIAGFEGGAAAQAFASLPERWQLVLWHLEVEGAKPAEIAPMLGMSPNSVSALAYRAREGLRQAFLQQHIADLVEDDCRWTHDKLGAYVREGLSRRDSAKVEDHLDGCRKCTAIFLELGELNSELAGVLGPIVLGGAAAAYLATTTGGTAAGGLLAGLLGRTRDALTGNGAAVAAGSAALGLATVTALVVVVTHQPGTRTTAERQQPTVQTPADPSAPDDAEPARTGRQPAGSQHQRAGDEHVGPASAGAAAQPAPPKAAALDEPVGLASPVQAAPPADVPSTGSDPQVVPPPTPGTTDPGTPPTEPPPDPPTDPGTPPDPPTDPGTPPAVLGLEGTFQANGSGNSPVATARLDLRLLGGSLPGLPLGVVLGIPGGSRGSFMPSNRDCTPSKDGSTLTCRLGSGPVEILVKGLTEGEVLQVRLVTPLLNVRISDLRVTFARG